MMTAYGGFNNQTLPQRKEQLKTYKIKAEMKNSSQSSSNNKLDSKVVDMMKILGYETKGISKQIEGGNEHLSNVYQRLLKEKQDALNFQY